MRTVKQIAFMGAALAVALSTAAAHAQYNSTIFGPNVYVFDASVPGTTINTTLQSVSNTSVNQAQFATTRSAFLFKPGNYTGVNSQVGFYTSIAGLGTTPDAVVLNGGGFYIDQGDSSGNLTTNFWRGMENLNIPVPSTGTERWGVSQGAWLRRIHISGTPSTDPNASQLQLSDGSCHQASGGFIADSTVDGVTNFCSQQQWYTRNSSLHGVKQYVWNFVYSGVTGGPAASSVNPLSTVVSTTPVSREKPFLYVDGSGNYNVFSPALQTNSSGTTWASGGLGNGTSLPISSFFIATPSSTLAQINSALSSGKNLILTPGIYSYNAPIQVTQRNAVVLGLGYATLVSQGGQSVMTVADVDGVQIAGLIVDAGTTNTSVLLQVGVKGATRLSHAVPTSLSDLTFRIGGATAGLATTALELDSNNVILDNVWAWRADHGTGVGWNNNPAAHGLVVNGDSVTALGLAVEHFQQSQTLWNGNNGETIFYQSEDPYDVPTQSSWMDGSMNGYPSYEVASDVCNHTAYGLSVYSFFTTAGVNIYQDNAIYVPNTTGMHFTNMAIVKLGGSGGINHIVDGQGGPTPSGANAADLASFSGTGSCSVPSSALDIDSGGGPVSPFVADTDYSGGSSFSTTHAINTAAATNPAPAAVYQTEREGVFIYTIPNLTAGSAHTVRLHFAELYFSAAQQRVFNVAINGDTVLSNFDIVKAAGSNYTANVQQFTATANSSGQIVISFLRGTTDQPLVSGIEVQ